jgi:hypothetical protein
MGEDKWMVFIGGLVIGFLSGALACTLIMIGEVIWMWPHLG